MKFSVIYLQNVVKQTEFRENWSNSSCILLWA